MNELNYPRYWPSRGSKFHRLRAPHCQESGPRASRAHPTGAGRATRYRRWGKISGLPGVGPWSKLLRSVSVAWPSVLSTRLAARDLGRRRLPAFSSLGPSSLMLTADQDARAIPREMAETKTGVRSNDVGALTWRRRSRPACASSSSRPGEKARRSSTAGSIAPESLRIDSGANVPVPWGQGSHGSPCGSGVRIRLRAFTSRVSPGPLIHGRQRAPGGRPPYH